MWNCTECEKSFSHSSGLSRHRTTVHWKKNKTGTDIFKVEKTEIPKSGQTYFGRYALFLLKSLQKRGFGNLEFFTDKDSIIIKKSNRDLLPEQSRNEMLHARMNFYNDLSDIKKK